jgi:cytochrome c oxidase subunit 2
MKKSFEMVVLVSAVAFSTMDFRASCAPSPEPRRVEITARRFAFDPNFITLKKGEPVVLVIRSSDVEHGLRVPDLGLDLRVPKHGVGELKFTPERVGDFVGHCSVFCGAGHGGMMLTLHIVG